jgi:pimeloyl-ACP methyl ester carboxylesterase
MERVTLASGIALAVEDTGPRDAPVLVFLHGFPENRRTWRHQIAALSGRYRCIAPDQRGYGDSDLPQAVADYTPDKLAGDVFQLADALGVERFTIVGHDWGGAIAWLVAMLGQPRRVTRAVIANAPHPAIFAALQWTDAEQRRASQYIRTFRDTALDPLIARKGLRPVLARALGGPWVGSAALLAAGLAMPWREAALLRRQWADPARALAMLNWYRATPLQVPPMDAPFALPEGWTAPPTPKLTIPTLVIWGMRDKALTPANIDGLDDHVTDLTLAPVPGAGHFVPWQAAGEVTQAMEAFLART